MGGIRHDRSVTFSQCGSTNSLSKVGRRHFDNTQGMAPPRDPRPAFDAGGGDPRAFAAAEGGQRFYRGAAAAAGFAVFLLTAESRLLFANAKAEALLHPGAVLRIPSPSRSGAGHLGSAYDIGKRYRCICASEQTPGAPQREETHVRQNLSRPARLAAAGLHR